MAEGTVQGDAAAQCLHGFVARVREACRWAEGDTGAPVAERKVGRVVELQRGGEGEAGAAGAGGAHRGDRDVLGVRADVELDLVAGGDVVGRGDLEVACASGRRGR